MLKEASFGKEIWDEALIQALQLDERTATQRLNSRTTQEDVLRNVPNNYKLKAFGCKGFDYSHKLKKRTDLTIQYFQCVRISPLINHLKRGKPSLTIKKY